MARLQRWSRYRGFTVFIYTCITVYMHVFVDLMYQSNPYYIRRGEIGCIISEKNVLFVLTDLDRFGYQVQTIPQFLLISGGPPYLGTFGNDDNSHNEITVQLCAKVA